jgi:hypothetical protein
MTSEHASDAQLQQFAIDSNACEPAIRTHIDRCADCQEKLAFYTQLISAIEVQPLPLPHFDTSELVLARLQTKKSNGWIYMAIAAVVLPIGIAMYIFRVQLFTGTSLFFIFLMAVTAVCVLAAMMIDQVKTYRHKMNILATK